MPEDEGWIFDLTHGDGLIPIKPPELQSLLGLVKPAGGKKITINNFVGGIDGIMVGDERLAEFSELFVKKVPRAQKADIIEKMKKVIEERTLGYTIKGTGIVYIGLGIDRNKKVEIIESDTSIGEGYIQLAIVECTATEITRITDARKWLYDVDEIKKQQEEGDFEIRKEMAKVAILPNAINIAKLGFKIDSYRASAANNMYNGFLDVFATTDDIDTSLSEQYTHISKLQKVIVSRGVPMGCVGWWGFEEGIGTIAFDSSGSGNDGILVNGPTWTTGKVGNALSFDGIDDYIQISNFALAPTSGFTMESWVKLNGPNVLNTYQFFIGDSTANYRLGVDPSFNPFINFGDRNDRWYSGFAFTPNVWYHYVLVGSKNPDGTLHADVYVNGNLLFSANTYSTSFYSSPLTMFIGRADSKNYVVNSLIDEVAIYNRALTAEEIADHYQKGLNGLPYGVPYENATVVSKAHTASSVPDSVLLIADYKDVDFYVSRDDGTTWTSITPGQITDISSQPTGTAMRLKAFLKNPTAELDNWSLWW
jgi:hypothetical protein